MKESVIFSFPGISVTPPHTPRSTGFLVLTSSPQRAPLDPSRYDIYLRLQYTPEDTTAATSVDFLIEAWRELRKSSPCDFILATEFGDLTITFPDLHHIIPQNDARIDLPAEMKLGMKWEDIVREFETEIDRFVSYSKNNYSLLSAPFCNEGSSSNPGPKTTMNKPYDPNGYPSEKRDGGGQVVLVDEESGDQIGELDDYHVNSIGVVPGSKDPVEITFPDDGQDGVVTVRPADYLLDASHPVYRDSSLVQGAATISRFLVTSSVFVANAMQSGAKSFTEKTQPVAKPVTFQPSTHQRFKQVHTLTTTAAKFSSSTLGKVQTLAQNAGAKISGRDQKGQARNPGIFNKSLIAFCTVADGVDYATKSVLKSGSEAATVVVQHRYGNEAGNVAKTLTGSVKNAALVYIDASGVSRRAVVKGIAKGMVVGRVKDGGEVIVPPNHLVDGLPPGWGDGPLGGPNAGPPNIATTQRGLFSPPDYSTATRSYSDASSSGYTNPASAYPPSEQPSHVNYNPTSAEKGKYTA